MIRNDPPPPPPSPPAKRVNVAVLLILAAVFVSVPLLAFLAILMWLNQTSFASVDEIDPGELATMQVQLLNLPRGPQNRPDPPEGETLPADENTRAYSDPDIGPVELTRPDFAVMLQPLRDAEPIESNEWPASPFLGEIKVRFKDGRPGTIRLYWASERPGDSNSPARVYMKIGSNKYRACSLKELRTFAEACAGRGTPVGR